MNITKSIHRQYSHSGIGWDFDLGSGVKQSSVLLPLLFILYMKKLLVEMRERFEDRNDCLRYAYDVALIANTKEGFQQIMQQKR